MNKIYTLLFFCLLIVTGAYAQLPNPSFENWTPYPSGSYPTFWVTSDSTSVALGAGHSAVQEGADKCDSNYSVKLTSFVVFSTNFVPGVATNGKINGVSVTNVIGGNPDTLRSAQFAGCYKYTPSGVDTGLISAVLTKWNGSARDTIALAVLNPIVSASLINFQANFVYRSSANPDSVLVLLMSGRGVNATNTGSSLIIDNLHFAGIVGVDEISKVTSVHIYPQPAQNELNIQVDLSKNTPLAYEIADITGRKIITGNMESMNQRVNISSLSRGNYFVALRSEQGAILHTSKLVVSK